MDSLTRAYQSEMKRTRQAVSDRVASNWMRLPDLRDGSVKTFLDASLPVVQAGQSRAIALANAYSAQKVGVAAVAVDQAAIVGAGYRNGADMAEVYTRPFITARASIESLGYSAASQKGLSRLTSTADMDVALAATATYLAVSAALGGRVVGWTRVAEPSCCDYCQALDGIATGPDEPQPMHNRCGCTADPITKSSGLGGLIALGAGAIVGALMVRQHGELGPVITDRHDAFAGPDDLDSSGYVES